MLVSGFAGLGYQIIWTQEFALCLGNESASVLAVVTAFFAGLGVGALAFGSRVEISRHPQRWYAAAEALIGIWGLLLAVTMAPIGGIVLRVTGTTPSAVWQWSVAFVSTFVVLLPATAAMGVTLPAMERIVALKASEGRSIAGLYAANTAGAVLGVLAIALWLIPRFGLLRASGACVAFNLLAAVIAVRVWRVPKTTETASTEPPAGASWATETASAEPPAGSSWATETTASAEPPAGASWATEAASAQPTAGSTRAIETASAPTANATAALWRLVATGFLGIGFEILVVRVLSEVAEDTVYTFALLLALYLVGTTLGAFAHRSARASSSGVSRLRSRLLVVLGLACLTSTGLLYESEHVKDWMLEWSGGGFRTALAAEAALALMVFALPTPAMGALFSQLCNEAQRAGVPFGLALGVNTIGAAIAPVVFGLLIVPSMGLKLALAGVCAGYVLLGAGNVSRSPWPWLALAGCLAFGVLAPPLAFIDVPEGGRVVNYRDGVTAAVSVIEDADGVLRLRINNRQQEGASGSRRVDGRQAVLPMLLHPAPRRALFLGVGAGNTSATAAEESGVEVDAVELLPEVMEATQLFIRTFPAEVRARLHLISADARRYVKTTNRRYDVIVADNFHPARSGTGALYTVEHFAAVRSRLSTGGLFCQWLPLHQLDMASLKSVVRSFLLAYPHGYAILASNSLATPTVGLIGFADDRRFDHAQVAARLGVYGTPQRLTEFGVEDDLAILGAFIAGPAALTKFAADAPANTDDRPVVAYGAPRLTYAPDSTPVQRLSELLSEVSLTPGELVKTDADAAWAGRLAAYWAARNQFIESGRAVRPSADPAAMLDQVQQPLLAVLNISPDFRPAYDPLLRLAEAVATRDPDRGRLLLTELASLRPTRTEATRALHVSQH
jgi:spermidine synthase